MFGVRTIVLGYDLLTLTGAAQERARTQAVLIHATDTAAALRTAVCAADLPPRVARTTVAISGLNTVLAVVAKVARAVLGRRPDPGRARWLSGRCGRATPDLVHVAARIVCTYCRASAELGVATSAAATSSAVTVRARGSERHADHHPGRALTVHPSSPT